MKRRKNRVGLLIILGGLFFLGLFSVLSYRGTVRAQYPPAVSPTGGGVPGGFPLGTTNESVAAIAGNRPVNVARPLEVPPLYAFDCKVNDTCQQIVLVDSQTKRICVYHVKLQDHKSTIEMVASRNFQWDLKLDDFNGVGISPMQIKEQVLQQEGSRP